MYIYIYIYIYIYRYIYIYISIILMYNFIEINGETGENITIDDLPNDLVIQIEEVFIEALLHPVEHTTNYNTLYTKETLKNELSNCNLVEIMTPDDLLVGENNLKLNQPENIGFTRFHVHA